MPAFPSIRARDKIATMLLDELGIVPEDRMSHFLPHLICFSRDAGEKVSKGELMPIRTERPRCLEGEKPNEARTAQSDSIQYLS